MRSEKNIKQFAKENLEGDWGQRDADLEFSPERWQQCADFESTWDFYAKKVWGSGIALYSHHRSTGRYV